MNVKKPKTEEPEVLPAVAGGQKGNALLICRSAEKVVRYHLASERCANLAIWCAAMAGAEIHAKKKELGHGNGFVEWKDSLPFSPKTAQNYMRLADGLQEKLSTLPKGELKELLPALKGEQESAQKAIALLNLPDPLDVFNPAHDRIAKLIHHVTSGATLRQLYFDWGIMPAPKPKELLEGRAPDLAPGETLDHLTAVQTFDKLFAEFWTNVRDYKLHLHLDVADLKKYSLELLDLRRKFDELAKRG